jgi:hypothetical protein
MVLERPLWRFAHPHFCVCVKPLHGFFQRKRKNVANLLSLSDNFYPKISRRTTPSMAWGIY